MTEKEKRIITVVTVILPSVVISVIFGIMMLLGNLELSADKKMYEAQAARYVKEKYGDSPKLLSSSASHYRKNGGARKVDGIIVFFDGFEVNIDGDRIGDNRQYDEICAAIEEHYINDSELGSSYSGKWTITYCSNDYRSFFTRTYYDGDIEKFVSEAKVTLCGEITYEGYPEKRDEYRKLLTDKMAEINRAFDRTNEKNNDYLDFTIYIHDPTLKLPEMTHKYDRETLFPSYEEYFENIAFAYTGYTFYSSGGHVSRLRTAVYQPEFFEIDEYTAIADDMTPIVSENEIVFEEVDLSDKIVAYPERYKFSHDWEKLKLTTRDHGWKMSLVDHEDYYILLRLDREHYSITDTTVPLIVADQVWAQQENHYYITVGYFDNKHYDYEEGDWYYMDDDNLYLYINSSKYLSFGNSGQYDWILTFSDE